jgi:hypothetical protein
LSSLDLSGEKLVESIVEFERMAELSDSGPIIPHFSPAERTAQGRPRVALCRSVRMRCASLV